MAPLSDVNIRVIDQDLGWEAHEKRSDRFIRNGDIVAGLIDGQYPDGQYIPDVGYYIAFGTEDIAGSKFMRKAFDSNIDEIAKAAEKAYEDFTSLKPVGRVLVGTIRDSIRDQGHVVTGTMLDSVKFKLEGD